MIQLIGYFIFTALILFIAKTYLDKKGHPKALFYLFFAEMWERFSFYGMRALLTLYLIKDFYKDLQNNEEIAYGIYAAYGALVYLTPLLGGYLADKYIGYRKSILFGGILMALGHFFMAFPNEFFFYGALGLLIMGNGFFKPNISTLVGSLYEEGDIKRDSGFTIFYMGINLGAMIAPLFCGYLGEVYGWHYGFGMAGIGMLAGLVVFWKGIQANVLGDKGLQPVKYINKVLIIPKTNNNKISIVAAGAMVIAVFLPYVKMGMLQVSLFDIISQDFATKTTLLLVFALGALISGLLDKANIARICSGAVLLMMIYIIYEVFKYQSGLSNLNLEINIFSFVGIGAYVMLISSIVGIIFSQVEEIKYINKKLSGISITNIIYIIGFILVPVFAYLIILDKDSQILGSVLSIVGLVVLAYVGYIIFDYKVVKKDHQSGDRLIALMILAVFCTIFWACFEQAGSSITVWVDKCVNLVGMNASQTNAINPAYIVLLAIPFSWMWTKLGFMNKNPNTPMKFALGIFQLGLGFLIFAATAHFIGDNGKIPFLFVFLGYFLITTGELFLSPIGLSKVTELSPKRIAAFMMGVWFLSSTFAHYISGEIAKLTTSGISGESNWLSDLTNWFMGYPDQSNEAIATLLQYNSIYGQIGFVTIFISIFVVIISPFIKKLMHGLH